MTPVSSSGTLWFPFSPASLRISASFPSISSGCLSLILHAHGNTCVNTPKSHMASGSHSVLKTQHSRKCVRDPVEGQENGAKDTAARTMGNREPGQEAVVKVQVKIRKVKAEVNPILFTDGESEAQNEPGWGFRFLAFMSVVGTPDLVCNPDRKCGFFFLLCPTAVHTALGGLGALESS